jgi:hypothetical protein
MIGKESILNEFSYIGRIFAGCCSLTIAVFTWRAFRPAARWAKWIVCAAGALILAGLTVSAFEGDWEGANPLTYTGSWYEWAGGAVPFVWLAVESLYAYSQARLRVRVGLGDPLVANRFLLIGVYGTLASSTYPIYLWMYIEYERYGTWSDLLSTFVGIVEVISLAALWISFSAPDFYRRWVDKAQETT